MKAIVTWSTVAALSLMLAGCTQSREPVSENDDSETGNHHVHDNGGSAHGESDQSDMAKMKAELAKLSPEDAAAVEKQHMCPVSGEMLGTMGAPIKLEAEGQSVWVCCSGCKDSFQEDPQKYIAKLPSE